MTLSDTVTSEQALRLAAEIVLCDEALTADLVDPAAKALLQWAHAAAARAAAACISSGQSVGRDQIIEAVHPVRAVARAVNDLVAARHDLTEDEFLAELLALVDLAGHVAPANSSPVACEDNTPSSF